MHEPVFVFLNCIYDYMNQVISTCKLLLLINSLCKISCFLSNLGYTEAKALRFATPNDLFSGRLRVIGFRSSSWGAGRCPQGYLNNGTLARFSFSDSPRRLWWYHWICWLLSVVGIFCILLAHDHYTVDVVVAYYITTRLFWWYHTMANQQVLKEASQMNLLARVWWYRPFQYFEKNVQGIVPRSYHWPFPWPVVHLGRQVKYSRLVNDT